MTSILPDEPADVETTLAAKLIGMLDAVYERVGNLTIAHRMLYREIVGRLMSHSPEAPGGEECEACDGIVPCWEWTSAAKTAVELVTEMIKMGAV